jgi:hypothetical protein
MPFLRMMIDHPANHLAFYHQPLLLQEIEGTVNGGAVDTWGTLIDLANYVLGGQVSAFLMQNFKDNPPLGSDPETPVLERY